MKGGGGDIIGHNIFVLDIQLLFFTYNYHISFKLYNYIMVIHVVKWSIILSNSM